MQYDHIGKYDSILEDGNASLDDIDAPSFTRLPWQKGSHGNTADVMQQFYKDIDGFNIRNLKPIYYVYDSYLFDKTANDKKNYHRLTLRSKLEGVKRRKSHKRKKATKFMSKRRTKIE